MSGMGSKRLGLIGYPLTHSFSKFFFEEKFKKLNLSNYYFDVFSMIDIHDFITLRKNNPDLIGLSVTIPHKESILPYLDELDETASAIAAVNCIKFSQDKLVGFNTDAFGFRMSLRPFLDSNHTKALVLGTGGAAKAVAYVLENMGISVCFVSRQRKTDLLNSIFYQELNPDLIDACRLIVNTSPLGMYPNIDTFPNIPYQAIGDKHLVYDLTYNPTETLFLKKAKRQGALISNGYNMLCFQAEEAWRIWTGL